MAGRLRTASRPLRTLMLSAVYFFSVIGLYFGEKLGKRDGYASRIFAQPNRHIFRFLLYLKNGLQVKENPLKKTQNFDFFLTQNSEKYQPF